HDALPILVLDAATLSVVEEVVAHGKAEFPYVPGLFAFRELPALVDALQKLTITPDLLVCDGYGLAHPRGFGLACHLGVITGLPALGVGKTECVGTSEAPPPERGAGRPVLVGGAGAGRAPWTRRPNRCSAWRPGTGCPSRYVSPTTWPGAATLGAPGPDHEPHAEPEQRHPERQMSHHLPGPAQHGLHEPEHQHRRADQGGP